MKSGFDILLHYASWLVNCLYHFICTANLFKNSTTVSYGSHHHAKHKIMIIKPILNFATSKPKLRHLARITHICTVFNISFIDTTNICYYDRKCRLLTYMNWSITEMQHHYVTKISEVNFTCIYSQTVLWNSPQCLFRWLRRILHETVCKYMQIC